MRKSKKQAFSLVEVVLALGIVAFAFVAILGLIPAGMSSFRQAINISVCSQIGQKVIADAFQADYDTLLTPLGSTQDSPTPFLMNYRYFDEEGNEILQSPRPTTNTQNTPPSTEQFVYLVVTKVSPYIILPGLPSSTASTIQLPMNGSPQTATITVQVVFDPSQYIPTSGDVYGSGNGPTTQSYDLLNSPNIPPANILTYYAHITRN
jgi:uncharacterized protein (TIGR02598 family)